MQQFKDAGYRTEAHYMHLPRAEAAKRAVARFLGPTGRFVPPEVILSNTGNEASFDQIKGLVDAWSFRDNSNSDGSGPKLISESAAHEADAGAVGEDGRDGRPTGDAGQPGPDAGVPAGGDRPPRGERSSSPLTKAQGADGQGAGPPLIDPVGA